MTLAEIEIVMGTEIVIEGMEDVVVATDTEVVIEEVVLEEAVAAAVAVVVVVALIAASPVILLEIAGKIIFENRKTFKNCFNLRNFLIFL